MTIKLARTTPVCGHCQAPHADNAEICGTCANLLRKLLEDVPGVLIELNTTLSRQAKVGAETGGRSGSTEQPLAFDLPASEATDFLLASTVTRWALDIWRATQSPLKSSPPTDPVAYLLGRVDEIRFRGYAPALIEQLRAALDNAWQTIDLAAEWLEAGQCECGRRLLAKPDQVAIECPGCQRTYDVRDRRRAMVAYAENLLVSAKDAERLVDVFIRTGADERIRRRVPSGSVRGWASKGELAMTGYARDGRTVLYRLGDIFDRAFSEATKASAA